MSAPAYTVVKWNETERAVHVEDRKRIDVHQSDVVVLALELIIRNVEERS
jgi:hypothetical protein